MGAWSNSRAAVSICGIRWKLETARRDARSKSWLATSAWSGLVGLIVGLAAGVWWWGVTVVTLVLAVTTAAAAAATAML